MWWTRDRAPRDTLLLRAHVGPCNLQLAPLRAPPRGTEPPSNRREPRLHTAGFGRRSPSAKGPPRTPRTSTPHCPPANPAERRSPAAAPSGCGDPPRASNSAAKRGPQQVVSEQNPKPWSRAGCGGESERERGADLQPHSAATAPAPKRAAAAAISPTPGVNRRGNPRPASPRPNQPSQRGRFDRRAEREPESRPRLQPAESQRLRGEPEPRRAAPGAQRSRTREVQSAPAPPQYIRVPEHQYWGKEDLQSARTPRKEQ